MCHREQTCPKCISQECNSSYNHFMYTSLTFSVLYLAVQYIIAAQLALVYQKIILGSSLITFNLQLVSY